MEPLYFCRDGVLRRRYSTYDPHAKKQTVKHVPVLAWQESVDPHVFMKSLHSCVVFEDGLTVGEMMENLAPWAEQMIGVACMDFPAYLEECRRGGGGSEKIEKIEIDYHMAIEAVPKFEKTEPPFSKLKNGMFRMNIGKPAFTGRLNIDDRWDYLAILKEEHREEYEGSRGISLSFTPISEYAHIPIVISRDAKIYDSTGFEPAYLGTEKPLLNPEHPNVIGREVNGGRKVYEMPIEAPTPTMYEAIVHGFLWDIGFDYSPVKRDENAEKVRSSMEETKEMLDAALDDGDEIDETYDENEDREVSKEQLNEHVVDLMRIEKITAKAEELGLSIKDRSTAEEEEE